MDACFGDHHSEISLDDHSIDLDFDGSINLTEVGLADNVGKTEKSSCSDDTRFISISTQTDDSLWLSGPLYGLRVDALGQPILHRVSMKPLSDSDTTTIHFSKAKCQQNPIPLDYHACANMSYDNFRQSWQHPGPSPSRHRFYSSEDARMKYWAQRYSTHMSYAGARSNHYYQREKSDIFAFTTKSNGSSYMTQTPADLDVRMKSSSHVIKNNIGEFSFLNLESKILLETTGKIKNSNVSLSALPTYPTPRKSTFPFRHSIKS